MQVTMPQARHLNKLVEMGYKVEGDRVEVTKVVTDPINAESPEQLIATLKGMAERHECLTYKTEVGIQGKMYKSIILCGKLAKLGGFDYLVMNAKTPKSDAAW